MSVKWQASSPQKHRLRWTGELEQFFNNAVDKLGGVNVATPQAVVDILKKKYPQITTSHVKSHLQHIRNKKQALSKRKLQIPDQFYIKTEEMDDESEAVILEENCESERDNDRLVHHHYYGNVRNENFFNKDKLKIQEQRKLFFKEYFENKYQQQASFRKKFIYDQLQVCQNVDTNDQIQIEGLKQCVQQIIDDFQQCVPAINQDPIFEKYQESLLNIQPHHPLKQEIQELTKIFVFCHAHIFKDMLKEAWRNCNQDGDIFNGADVDPYFQRLQYFEQYYKMGPSLNCADLLSFSNNHKPTQTIFKRSFNNSLCDTDTQNQFKTPRKDMFNTTNSVRCDTPMPTPTPTPISSPAPAPNPNPTSAAVPDSSDTALDFQLTVVDEVQNKTLQQSIFQKFLEEQQNQQSNNFIVEGGTETPKKESNGFVFSKVVKSKDSMYCFNSRSNGDAYFGQQDTDKIVSKQSSDLMSNKRLKFSKSNSEFEGGGRINLKGTQLQNNLKIYEIQDFKFEQQQQQEKAISNDSVSKFKYSNGDNVIMWNRLQTMQFENPPKFAGFSPNPEEDINRCVQT